MGDITYIATYEGWLYLAEVLDLFSNQVVGWSMQPHMQISLVTDALRMAWFHRAPDTGVDFHSDRGSQYCGHEFQSALASYRMKRSYTQPCRFLQYGRGVRAPGRVLCVGHPAIQHHHLNGVIDAERAAVLCSIRAGGHR